MWGKTAVAEFSAYCASKHANIDFMGSLARELAPRGISVNAVCPGWVRTVASMGSLSELAARKNRSEHDLLAEIVGAQAIETILTGAHAQACIDDGSYMSRADNLPYYTEPVFPVSDSGK